MDVKPEVFLPDFFDDILAMRSIETAAPELSEAVALGYLVSVLTIDPCRLAWKRYCKEQKLPEIIVRSFSHSITLSLWYRWCNLHAIEICEILMRLNHHNYSFDEDSVYLHGFSSLEDATKIAKGLACAVFHR